MALWTQAGAGEGAGRGAPAQNEGLAEPSDRHSPPPWIGLPPIFNLMRFYRTPISNHQLFQGPTLSFDRTLLLPNADGDYAIPMAIAAPIGLLHMKHLEELTYGRAASFINQLDHPVIPNALSGEDMEKIVQFLLLAPPFDECVERFMPLSARMVFEVLITMIQRAEDLRVHLTCQTTFTNTIADFLRPESWSQHPPPQPTQTMEEYMKQVEGNMAEEMWMRHHVANSLHYGLYKDLKRPENQQLHLVFRFLVINLMRLLRDFCLASPLPDGLVDGRFLLLDYARTHVESMRTILRVLAIRFGQYLIQPSSLPNHEARERGEMEPQVLAGRILTNAILLNTPEAFYCDAGVLNFLLHSVLDCNLQNPQCICWSFQQRFPDALGR
ncbi:hypothetical protein TcWFU_003566 [Taenia crassiceps]|uniref:Ubiquitin conjugation factor E4 core domain-containing protein n=1 Tax=Taenia crassiceps TaxID=6207 RepID=A0ABR4QAK4_9CEST